MKLVLFDIDGTILRSHGAGRRAMERALVDVFGSPGSRSYHYDGKTDMQIVRDLMRLEGYDDAAIDASMPNVLERYIATLDAELAADGPHLEVCAGVFPLLDALERRDDRLLGLLTGNLERGAASKLRAVGIDPERFPVCAFGSDHEIRSELPAIAQRRARDVRGHTISGPSIIVIGDTPADIDCGRSIGAQAIAVATGRYSVDELAAHEPLAIFPDLSDTRAVLDVIDVA